MKSVAATAYARVGLLGNPSDIYEGRVIAFTFSDFAAQVLVEDSDHIRIVSDTKPIYAAPTWKKLTARLKESAIEGGAALIAAAIKKFSDYCEARRIGPSAPESDASGVGLKIGFTSSIPHQVGLGGSSAIIIAVLRALMARYQVPIDSITLADLALKAETEELGITAGPQDRVVQAYEGLLCMNFRPPLTESSITALDAAILPPLFVAWNPNPGQSSGNIHKDIRHRFECGNEDIAKAMLALGELVDNGRHYLKEGAVASFQKLVNRNYDIRATIWPISPNDREMVSIGRGKGAAVKLTGSGGSVIGVMTRPQEYKSIKIAYESAGYQIIRPQTMSTRRPSLAPT